MFARRVATPVAPSHFQSVARSHIGHVRTVNEDRLLNCPEHGLWAVADGMGGHSLGDQAATIVIRALADLAEGPERIERSAIDRALEMANRSIMAMGSKARQTCGSTVAGLHVTGSQCLIFWAGDSRVYRLRNGHLVRLSRDHSFVQELADAGVLTELQARVHPRAHVITRAVGASAELAVDYAECDMVAGDIFLLCSDGLSGLLDDDAISSTFAADLCATANQLLAKALDAGGTDNVSLILASGV
ncbi:MAG: protein phosphatase 2C domain-containing protein [Sphingobium sp.]|uniref:PP2C family protein-serine/threonine phosphatase n=1 Tax=Sphingobium sp. TaxID=1912891 RepID=UPI0029B49F81|nr:protein phosphatase 2C domain-containing protein [Sphingobium sp.]MDX3909612.1 protein phosphatase 2C domain-containing protein [Sphingobium sp.]